MRRPVSCYDKALDLLSRRSHLRRELAFKLNRRGYTEEEVESTLGKLEDRGFLDDLATSKEWVASRLARGPEGRMRLLAGLVRRGASREVAEEALADLGSEDESAMVRQAADRWWARRGRGEPEKDRAALARHLERRGFPRHAIVTVLAAGLGAESAEPSSPDDSEEA